VRATPKRQKDRRESRRSFDRERERERERKRERERTRKTKKRDERGGFGLPPNFGGVDTLHCAWAFEGEAFLYTYTRERKKESSRATHVLSFERTSLLKAGSGEEKRRRKKSQRANKNAKTDTRGEKRKKRKTKENFEPGTSVL